MNNKKIKKIISSVIIITILIGINIKTYAENEITEGNTTGESTTNTTNQNETTQNSNTTEQPKTNTQSNQSNSSQTNTQTQNSNKTNQGTVENKTNNTEKNQNQTTTNTNQKSNNANLSNLGIKPNDFSGFNPSKTEYNVTVPDEVEEVDVYAQAQNSKATIEGTGKTKLSYGENEIEIIVTAEDGTTKTYTINITKGEQANEKNDENSTETNKNSGKGLSNLKIEEAELTPNFDTNIYEYKVKYIGQSDKLQITTDVTDETYIVEVVGNKDLKEGENIITILVSEEGGENVATYQIVVEKSLIDEEALVKEQKKQKIMICGITFLILLIIIIFIIAKIKNKNKYNDESLYDPLYEDENEDENEEEYTQEEARQKFLDSYMTDDLDEDEKQDKNRGRRYK